MWHVCTDSINTRDICSIYAGYWWPTGESWHLIINHLQYFASDYSYFPTADQRPEVLTSGVKLSIHDTCILFLWIPAFACGICTLFYDVTMTTIHRRSMALDPLPGFGVYRVRNLKWMNQQYWISCSLYLSVLSTCRCKWINHKVCDLVHSTRAFRCYQHHFTSELMVWYVTIKAR